VTTSLKDVIGKGHLSASRALSKLATQQLAKVKNMMNRMALDGRSTGVKQ
jgi:hypothetical protein